jgi:hypothetical protein
MTIVLVITFLGVGTPVVRAGAILTRGFGFDESGAGVLVFEKSCGVLVSLYEQRIGSETEGGSVNVMDGYNGHDVIDDRMTNSGQ